VEGGRGHVSSVCRVCSWLCSRSLHGTLEAATDATQLHLGPDRLRRGGGGEATLTSDFGIDTPKNTHVRVSELEEKFASRSRRSVYYRVKEDRRFSLHSAGKSHSTEDDIEVRRGMHHLLRRSEQKMVHSLASRRLFNIVMERSSALPTCVNDRWLTSLSYVCVCVCSVFYRRSIRFGSTSFILALTHFLSFFSSAWALSICSWATNTNHFFSPSSCLRSNQLKRSLHLFPPGFCFVCFSFL